MKISRKVILVLCLIQGLSLLALRAEQQSAKPKLGDLSLRLEVERAINRGLQFLVTQQDEEGFWGDKNQPALSALVLSSMGGNPERAKAPELYQAELNKGYEYLLSKVKDDGGIYGKGLACYNTSLSMMALLSWEDPRARQAILAARRFLINQQSDFDVRGETDNVYDGGIGYGGTYAHSDLSNTHLALEALHYSRGLVADGMASPEEEIDRKMDLNWQAAIRFVEQSQNRPESSGKWASSDKENYGGFVYFPGNSKAGESKLADGTVALRSYGSMGYAGLLSFIYAQMEQDDPRVQAVVSWLKQNFSVEENPGMGKQGLYYYYHAMAKGLSLAQVQEIELEDGSRIDWRKVLALKLFDQQKTDGSWVNESGRWWENDPVLVTSYALLALEHIYHGL